MELGCGGGWETAWVRPPQIPVIWLDAPTRLKSPDLVSGARPGPRAWTQRLGEPRTETKLLFIVIEGTKCNHSFARLKSMNPWNRVCVWSDWWNTHTHTAVCLGCTKTVNPSWWGSNGLTDLQRHRHWHLVGTSGTEVIDKCFLITKTLLIYAIIEIFIVTFH